MVGYLKYAGVLLLLIILQKTVIGFIDVTSYQITPDIVLIGLVFIGIKEGKITGTVSGFLAGLILDLFSFSFVGLMALSKCVAGFTAGYFNDENKADRYLKGYMFTVITVIISIINNIIYFTIYFQGTNLTFIDVLLRYVLPTAVYTGIFSVFPIIFARRRYIR